MVRGYHGGRNNPVRPREPGATSSKSHPLRFALHRHIILHWQIKSCACYLVIMVLPLISRAILQTFRCVTYDETDEYSTERGAKFMFVDPAIDCRGAKYRFMVIYASANVLIWPVGVPLGLLVCLWRISRFLDPRSPGSTSNNKASHQRARLGKRRCLSSLAVQAAVLVLRSRLQLVAAARPYVRGARV